MPDTDASNIGDRISKLWLCRHGKSLACARAVAQWLCRASRKANGAIAGAIFDAHVRAGRKVQLPHLVVVGIVDDKVAYEQIYWDQASLLVQVGVLDPAKLPVTGAEQAHKLMDPTLPSNDLIRRAERSRAGSHRP
jgi:hypothetical protein